MPVTGHTRTRRASALATFLTLCCCSPALALLAEEAASQAQSDEARGAEWSTRGWLDDLETLKAELEASYPNLLWKASYESGVDLPALASAAERALRRATTDQEAFEAISEFIEGIGDGHLYIADEE
jgi:hypothetical protein